MKRIAAVFFFFVRPALFLLGSVTWLATDVLAEKTRTAIPQANLNYLSIYVADGRGFFKDEGLDNETVIISGSRWNVCSICNWSKK